MSKKSAAAAVYELSQIIISDIDILKRHLRRFVFIGLALELSLIILTRYLQERTRFNYFSEGTYFTWFSSLQLAAIAVVAGIISYVVWIADTSGNRLKNIIAWSGAGLFGFYLSFDEWFSIHEAIAPYSGKLLKSAGIMVKRDVPFFIAIGLISLVIWFFLKADLNRFEPSKLYAVIGFVMLVVSAVLDTAGSHIFFVIWEDSFKILGFFFVLASFVGSLMYKIHLLAKD